MKPVYKFDMIHAHSIHKDIRDGIKDLLGRHNSAISYKIDGCVQLVEKMSEYTYELSKQIKELTDVVEVLEIRFRKAANAADAGKAIAGDSKGSRVWVGKVQSVELDKGDGVE